MRIDIISLFPAIAQAALAESIMEKGQQAPILVRPDGERFVRKHPVCALL